MPLISIFVPVYNAEKYIRKCLDSILAQTLQDFELFIHDDGSTDRSYKICQEYANRDKRVILEKGENGTSIEAMNKFVNECSSELVAFVDNDDYIATDYFEVLYNAICDDNLDIAIGSYTLINDNGDILPWYTPNLKDEILTGEDICRRFLTSLDIEGFRWNKIFKKEIFLNNNITIKNKFPGDIPYVYSYISHVKRGKLVNNKGYYYRQRENSEVSTKKAINFIGMMDAIKNISKVAEKKGFVLESEYYYIWRSINGLFLAKKDTNLYSEQDRDLLKNTYNWNNYFNKSLWGVWSVLNRYDNYREGKLKFNIKALLVRLYYA